MTDHSNIRTKNREFFVAMGRDDAAAGRPARYTPGGWRGDAYCEGRASFVADKATEGPPVPAPRGHGKSHAPGLALLVRVLDESSRDWPGAAREHALDLAGQIVREQNVGRRARLMRSLGRVTARYVNFRDRHGRNTFEAWVDEMAVQGPQTAPRGDGRGGDGQ